MNGRLQNRSRAKPEREGIGRKKSKARVIRRCSSLIKSNRHPNGRLLSFRHQIRQLQFHVLGFMNLNLHCKVGGRLALALFFVAAFLFRARAADEITSLSQLIHLQPVSDPKPMRLKGVIVCYDAGWHQLYLHDGEHTSYFNADDFKVRLELGQEVEITGLARSSNVWTNLGLTVLGKKALPPAKVLKLNELAREHSEWIETSGRVLSAETSRGRLALLLNDQRQNGLVYVLGGAVSNDFTRLLGVKVRVRGINASKAMGERLEGAMIFAPGLSEITALENARAERPDVPVVSIGSVLGRELGPWTNEWVHLNGLVVSYLPGKSLTVKDPTGVIRAEVVQMTEIAADERVDVWGFLDAGKNEAILKSAWFEAVRPVLETVPRSPPLSIRAANAQSPGPLTRISDVVQLSQAEAATGVPVRLRGVLTYADPDWRVGFLQDAAAAIYVDLPAEQKTLRSEQWIEIDGVTAPGGFAPEVLSSNVAVLGATNLPAPARVDLADLANGHLDAHWVEMEGIVRRVDQQTGHLLVTVMTPKGRFKLIIPGFENTALPLEWIDALVRVQGACTSEPNARHQISGIVLHASSLEQLRVIEPAPKDPFAIQPTQLDAVATFNPNPRAARRIKVSGTVTLNLPGEGFILQDSSGGMRILTRQSDPLAPGDHIEALGFPAITDFAPFLEEAVFRRLGTAPLPAPKKTTAEQILLNGANDAQLVEITGRLLQNVPHSANPQLVLQEGSSIFTAQLAAGARRNEVPALKSGSLVRLSGVCLIQGGERHEPQAFRLYLRQPEDIRLLESPPWWTARHTFVVAGGLVLVSAAAFGWIGLLRRQVSTQTKLIRQKLEKEAALEQRYQDLFENANDMLYTHDRQGRLTSINQAGEGLLGHPRKEILNRNFEEFIVEEQRPAARQWLESICHGSSVQTVEWDFLAASGQRVKLEISTRVIEQRGRFVEVEGIARDITERKRLEREILEISNREQRRIGHDLHDGVCQQLAGITLMTSSLADELEEKQLPQSSEAAKISDLLGEVIEQTRGVARGLFPVRLEQHGLVCALEELAANASDLFKMTCQFTAEDPPALIENEIALHLYYIVLEAVANASRHGHARHVQISLKPAGDRYELIVRDDGTGFAAGTPTTPGGMGLRILHYRARVIGATLTVHSRPEEGTVVRCLFLPVLREARPGRNNGGESVYGQNTA